MEIKKISKLAKINNMPKDENSKESKKDIIIILKGSIIALILTIIMLTIYAAILSYTNISEDSMTLVILVIAGLSIIIGSSITNIKLKRKGIINGALIGLIYILIIYILSSVITGVFNLNSNSIIMIIVSIVTGMIGGIIGVNMK